MTKTMCLRKTGATTAELIMSVFRAGSFLSAKRASDTVIVRIEDSDDLRLISANLNHMKTTGHEGLVEVNFGKGQNYNMDRSVWTECADALLAFSISVDCANLGI